MPETNPDEDNELPKLTIFDRSRRNDEGKAEGAELTERNGCDDSFEKGLRQLAKERFKHDGIDREQDGRLEIQVCLDDHNRCEGP